MTRHNEHDAHKHLERKKTYTEGYLDGRREMRDQLATVAYKWLARCAFAFVAGAILGLVRGAL